MRPIVNSRRPRGFTLIELLVVIFIIGLLLAFVLAASLAGAESARVRATQALITKLSIGLEERMEALLATQTRANGAHQFLGAINTPSFPAPAPYGSGPNAAMPWGVYQNTDQRAAVLARLDQIRQEFPDVFFIDPAVANGGAKGLYPLQFAGLPYPNPADPSAGPLNYVLPLGHMSPLYMPESYNGANPIRVGLGDNPQAPQVGDTPTLPFSPHFPNTGTGINGASYSAAAALYKLIGYTAKGYDGIDNNGDGFVDEYLEGISDPQDNSGTNGEAATKVDTFLRNHTHKTARAEMLYALLVEGIGPLGSVFSREDFHDNEVKDTDGDGVPEFVDGWGEPLQFYRWPYAHHSDIQKGNTLYGPFEPRERMPLDPNNQLTALSWWCDNTSPTSMSSKCVAVQNYFGPLYDPFWVNGASPQPSAWDRSGQSPRRAFLTKFLIVSGGPDRQVGIPRLGDAQVRNPGMTPLVLSQAINGTIIPGGASGPAIMPGESWGMLLPGNDSGDVATAQTFLPAWATDQTHYFAAPGYEPYLDNNYALDDLTNQGLQNQAGGFR